MSEIPWIVKHENGTTYFRKAATEGRLVEMLRRWKKREEIVRKAISKIVLKKTPLTPFERKKLKEYCESEPFKSHWERFQEIGITPPIQISPMREERMRHPIVEIPGSRENQ